MARSSVAKMKCFVLAKDSTLSLFQPLDPAAGNERGTWGAAPELITSKIQPRRHPAGQMVWAFQQRNCKQLNGVEGRFYRLKEI